MADLRGTVRYRFRHEEDDVDVVIEGEAVWVSNLVENMELKGVGWTMPIARASRPQNLSGLADDDDVPDEDAPPADLDPHQTLLGFRWFGDLSGNSTWNLKSIASASGDAAPRPDRIDGSGRRPRPPVAGQGSDLGRPQAEAWLKELMEVVVREHGATAMRTEDIEEVLGERLGDRSGGVLEVWLDSLFAAGKLVKVHGGQGTGWGPSPSWLKA